MDLDEKTSDTRTQEDRTLRVAIQSQRCMHGLQLQSTSSVWQKIQSIGCKRGRDTQAQTTDSVLGSRERVNLRTKFFKLLGAYRRHTPTPYVGSILGLTRGEGGFLKLELELGAPRRSVLASRPPALYPSEENSLRPKSTRAAPHSPRARHRALLS